MKSFEAVLIGRDISVWKSDLMAGGSSELFDIIGDASAYWGANLGFTVGGSATLSVATQSGDSFINEVPAAAPAPGYDSFAPSRLTLEENWVSGLGSADSYIWNAHVDTTVYCIAVELGKSAVPIQPYCGDFEKGVAVSVPLYAGLQYLFVIEGSVDVGDDTFVTGEAAYAKNSGYTFNPSVDSKLIAFTIS